MHTDTISFDIGSAKLQVPTLELLTAWLERATHQTIARPATPPAIGERWPGTTDIYAGLARDLDGGPDYHLLVAEEVLESATWSQASEWARSHEGYVLPDRREARLLWVNAPELFESEWYWSGTQSAGPADAAWAQHFGGGYQDDALKDNQFRARAVRRLTI